MFQILRIEKIKTGIISFPPTDTVDESAALKTEILVLKRRNDILAKKEKRIQGIVTEWGKKVI